MSIGPCQYPRCNDGHGEPVLTTYGMCEDCQDRYARLLGWLRDDYVHLVTEFPKPASNGTPAGQAPAKLGYGHPAEWASNEAQELAALLTEVHNNLDETLGRALPLHRTTGEALRVAEAIRVLSLNIPALCNMPGAGDVADELNAAHGHIRRSLGQARLIHRLPTPCAKCGYRSLIRSPGQDSIECQNCGKRYTADDYARLLRYEVGAGLQDVAGQRDDAIAAYDRRAMVRRFLSVSCPTLDQ